MFKIHMRTREGEDICLSYNPHLSTLTYEDGSSVITEEHVREFRSVLTTSKDTPNSKSNSVRVLKIQMGLGCNYSCSYCSQAAFVKQASVSSISNAEAFMSKIPSRLTSPPAKVELWGGEPLLYLNKIRYLVPEIRNLWPDTRISMITNGSLLTDSVVDFIQSNGLYGAISHDGPGQAARGPDPLDNPEMRRIWRRLLCDYGNKFHINSVLSANSFDLIAIRRWFDEKLGKDIRICVEGIVNVYNSDTLTGSGFFNKKKLSELTESVFYSMESSEDRPDFDGLNHKVTDFIDSLFQRRPVSALWQKCGMDKPDHIAVDLQGNVMTCQNTGAKGSHKIGHLDDFDNIRLTTSTHLSHRRECMSCPVVQLCKGGCMYLEGDCFNQNCHNEFAFNLGIMMAALHRLTGAIIMSIEGEMIRPPLPAG